MQQQVILSSIINAGYTAPQPNGIEVLLSQFSAAGITAATVMEKQHEADLHNQMIGLTFQNAYAMTRGWGLAPAQAASMAMDYIYIPMRLAKVGIDKSTGLPQAALLDAGPYVPDLAGLK